MQISLSDDCVNFNQHVLVLWRTMRISDQHFSSAVGHLILRLHSIFFFSFELLSKDIIKKKMAYEYIKETIHKGIEVLKNGHRCIFIKVWTSWKFQRKWGWPDVLLICCWYVAHFEAGLVDDWYLRNCPTKKEKKK